MKQTMKRSLALMLALVLCLGLAIGTSAAPAAQKITTPATGYTSAGQVAYLTTQVNGRTVVYNWGARGEDCVFLSTYATSFYTDSYETMATYQGSHQQNQVPNSQLYSYLQQLMTDSHVYYTYYDGTKNVRDFYMYTDCVSNDTTQVALLYRGGLVTSTWNQGSIWNQEHVWPQSLLKVGSNETVISQRVGDIMHLRPANPSENSSRGNTAYGTGSGYYDPGVSVRGDCARMVLYMYVRWGMSSKMWGSSGVMQNVDTLLRWIQEDPVDTWEMGRNDAVQSITGTRNVFVDYPELAFLLFGQQVPEDMVTPSGKAANPGTTEPPVTEPPVTEPPVTEPSVTEPPVTEPPVTEPPVTQPPATEPPATEPEVTEPEATEPEETQPGETQPGETQPEQTEPPATEPEESQPDATEPDGDQEEDAPMGVGPIVCIVAAVIAAAAALLVALKYKKKS